MLLPHILSIIIYSFANEIFYSLKVDKTKYTNQIGLCLKSSAASWSSCMTYCVPTWNETQPSIYLVHVSIVQNLQSMHNKKNKKIFVYMTLFLYVTVSNKYLKHINFGFGFCSSIICSIKQFKKIGVGG